MASPASGRKRINNSYAVLLQEIRVAQTAVQFLLAALLSVAFTPAGPAG
jgi:Family of unknown function (DUF6328)